jgi:hypothetical protein
LEPDLNIEHSIATDGFLILMKMLRSILLQDSVFLQDYCPNLFIWKHPIFSSAEYKTFAKELKSAAASNVMPEEERLAQAISLVANKLSEISGILMDNYNVITQKLDCQQESHSIQLSQMQNIFCCQSTIRIVADSIVDTFSASLSPTYTMMDSIIAAAQVPVPEEIPKYSLSKSLTTVAEVWMEYVHGIGTNQSVLEMETKYGTKWRRDPKEQLFFQEGIKFTGRYNS